MLRRLLPLLVLIPALIGIVIAAVWSGALGRPEGPGKISGPAVPREITERRAAVEYHAATAVGVESSKQILFGDLHVHTTYSLDAFRSSLPLFQGDGTHPPADACDFARYCSALDFWSINDHAETLTPQHWRETKDTIRQCNAVAGNPDYPDVVAFLGWEWTQTGPTPATHFGHRNVIFRDTAEDRVPTRPIAALGGAWTTLHDTSADSMLILMPLADLPNTRRYLDLARALKDVRATPQCPDGVDVRTLPADCTEAVATPHELFERLDQWGFDSIVIPHGTAWGLHAPPGFIWDNQLSGGNHDPRRETLLEIYSGHGNSEEYRDWRAIHLDDEGKPECPKPSRDFTPECWRTGEIIRERCKEEGVDDEECNRRAAEARRLFLQQVVQPYLVVPGQRAEDWLDAGQCTDCFLPAYDLRPGGSAQYALSITNFDDPKEPKRLRFGFIASSDNHSARPGTGYKEFARTSMTDAYGAADEFIAERMAGGTKTVEARAKPLEKLAIGGDDTERSTSFLYTGGLVAVHSEGRDRNSIWRALKRSEVYGTSGPRILLWFDLLNAYGSSRDDAEKPMGTATKMLRPPHFRVRAVGSLQQLPGCPELTLSALGPERIDRLCKGSCYHPAEERYPIARIEVVRIRPQMTRDEPIGARIEDPWRVFHCSDDRAGCVVEFFDPEFTAAARDSVYYVRAVQPPTPAINGDNLRCSYDEQGRCEQVRPCYSDHRGNPNDNCFASVEERAWSSPIFVDYGSE